MLALKDIDDCTQILSNPLTETRHNRDGIVEVLFNMRWYWNLASLLLHDVSEEQDLARLQDHLEEQITQLYEQLLSFQMRSIVLYYRNRFLTGLRDVFKLDDWAGQLGMIRDTESAVRRLIEQYDREARRKGFQSIANTAKEVQSDIRGIHSVARQQSQRQYEWREDDHYRTCMQDLYETDPQHDRTRIQTDKGGLIKDAYYWILDNDQFQQFRADSNNRLLWIKGNPGKGKTMLLCGIIDELEKDSNNRLAYFFCQATEPRRRNATAVLRGLIYCLVTQLPPLISYVQQTYDRVGKRLFSDENAWEAVSKILIAMLDDSSLDGAVLIVDALDECLEGPSRLLDFITKPSRVRWIVSSRDRVDIGNRLNNAEHMVGLQLELNQDSITTAVNAYIEHKVRELAELKSYLPRTSDHVRQNLTSKADGTFLWVALVCQELAKPEVIREDHTNSKLESFPAGLDPLYERMMGQISHSIDAEMCHKILAIASVAYRPISMAELQVSMDSLAKIDHEDLTLIIKACGSFLVLRDGVIYVIHQSAKDFLLDQSKKEYQKIFPKGISHQHYALFSKSLAALSISLQRNLCDRSASERLSEPIPLHDIESLAPIRYACVYWVDHLHESNRAKTIVRDQELQDGGMVHGFMRDKYLFWLEALGLLGKVSEGILAMHKLEALVVSRLGNICV
jgi:DNA replication protein DnaC